MLLETAEQLCVVTFAQLPPVHVHALGEPVAHCAVSVTGTLIWPDVGPEIVHPLGALETTHVSVWSGGDPVSAKLSQLLSLRWIFAAYDGAAMNATETTEAMAALASAALARMTSDRIILELPAWQT